MRGNVLNWWKGGGDGSVHSNVVAHLHPTDCRPRAADEHLDQPTRKISVPMPAIK
jgi:hypothetical protein